MNEQQRRPHWTTFAHGKRRERGQMNKAETKYAEHLERRKWAGEILWYKFEGVTFRLADKARYTPDFVVLLPSGLVECHEVKGFWAEAAKVRIKLAAELFPFRFVAVKARTKKDGGGWSEEEF